MTKAVDSRKKALEQLQARAKDLEARTADKPPEYAAKLIGQSSRLVAALIGGPLMGVALGAGIDFLAQTAPWGTVVGVFVGFAASVALAVRMAKVMSASATKDWGPPQALVGDEDDDS